MSSSEKDQNQNVLGSFVKFSDCRSKTSPLQNRRLIVRKDSPSPAENCKTGSESEPDGERKQKKRQQDDSSAAAEKENNICGGGGGATAKASLKLKVPAKIGQYCDENDDGFKTPTSVDRKIPAVLTCPPPPRKPKTAPLMKRRAPPRRRVLLDLTNDIELLFPPVIRADLGNNFKKIKQ